MGRTVRYSSNHLGIAHYLRERFQLWRFGPLVLMLFLGHLVNTKGLDIRILDIFTLGLLTLSFRLLDDLFDIADDRRSFPSRVLAQAENVYPFIIFLLILFLSTAILLYLSATPVSIYLLLGTLFCLIGWYQILRHMLHSKFLHSLVILLKYPMFLIVIAPGPPDPAVLTLLYLTFVLFELRDDPNLYQNRFAQRCTLGLTLVYTALLLLNLVNPTLSTSSWIVFGVSVLLQSVTVLRRNSLTPYMTFVNTTFIFCFLSTRYILI